MSEASGTAEAESSLSWPYSVVELLTELPQQSQGWESHLDLSAAGDGY